MALQVCYEVNDMNFDRKFNGLLEAMQFFDLPTGTILAFDQKDSFEKDGYSIQLIPAFEYLTDRGYYMDQKNKPA